MTHFQFSMRQMIVPNGTLFVVYKLLPEVVISPYDNQSIRCTSFVLRLYGEENV